MTKITGKSMLIPCGMNKEECYKHEDSMPPYSLISKEDGKIMAKHFKHHLKIYSTYDDSAEEKINNLYSAYSPKYKKGMFHHGEGAVVFNSTIRMPTIWIRTPYRENIVAPLYFHELGHCMFVQRYIGQMAYYDRPLIGRIKQYSDIKTDWYESVAFAIGSCAAIYWDIKNKTDYFLMSIPYMEYEAKERPLLILREVFRVFKNNENALKENLAAATNYIDFYRIYEIFFEEQLIR